MRPPRACVSVRRTDLGGALHARRPVCRSERQRGPEANFDYLLFGLRALSFYRQGRQARWYDH